MPLYINRLLLFFIFAYGCFYLGYAQNGGLRAYTLEDGLPQSQVHDIVQDDVGYLWLATRGGGICRFDGKEFKVWNEGDDLISNYVNTLKTVGDTLFIGNRKGLSIKTRSDIINYATTPVYKIFNKNHQILLATNSGLLSYDPAQGISKYPISEKIDKSRVTGIAYDGKLYWITTNSGLYKIRSLDGKTKPIRHSAFNFTAVLFKDNKIYAAAYDRGVLEVMTNAKSYGNNWINEPKRVTDLAIHKETELWCATDDQGVYIVDSSNRKIISRIGTKNGLAVSNVQKTITDSQSTIWIATSGGGFYKFFQNNFTHYDQDNGLKGNRVYAVHAIEDQIWASNSENGLVKIDNDHIHRIPQPASLRNTKIKTIDSDNKGNLWLGTEGKGIILKKISYLDNATSLKDTFAIENIIINKKRGLLSNWVRSIQVIEDTIWVASYSRGITRFVYDYKKNKVRNIYKFAKRSGIKDLYIKDLKPDKKGRMWYVTRDGDMGFVKNNKVTHYQDVLKQGASINSLVFKGDKIYLGTEGSGIWWSFLSKKPKFARLLGDKELYSNNIYQMIFDRTDHLWVGTERGVDKIKINLLDQIDDVFHYGVNDGFLGIETCLNAVTKDSSHNLWFGAIYGLTKYKPSIVKKKTIKPKIHFENLEIAYRPLDSINPDKWAKEEKVLQLSPEQTELSFNYITIDLDHPQDIEYRYRLNKTAWSPWTSEQKQNLAGLAFGPHSFTAQSRNYRWEQSDPITFKIFIDSPFYKKLSFQIAVLLLFLAAMTGISFYKIRKVKVKNKVEQERLQMQNHLLSLEQKALRLQMNPHFIFNVLNGIKAMGSNNPVKMNTTINTFATLMRETLYNSRKDDISLDQEINTIKHYIEVEKLMASKNFEYEINLDSDYDPEEVLIPPMLIQPFVENAIRHGILKGVKEGVLKVYFRTTEEHLFCKIVDNGSGIFQSQKAKLKTDHQSMALTVTTERLTSISGKDALKIEEVLAEDGSVTGTRIEFHIPLKTDY
ncbi:histidine kinase [Aquimarina sp. ERC-38]|uniref:ligand-binding sensor domain-containing protein n=1 Tax=Aquimarina sp. ERC-38 TaxID=2949996 RepID=UPI00224559EF|nr:histidine kinase [Aquimarina sp. ERC-38]UZO82412.1 histidine kinase [Aquimarina sp. ERC-38]